jgi:hypothetical protein
MKKLIFALACVGMLAACTKEETTNPSTGNPGNKPAATQYVKFKAGGKSYEYTVVPSFAASYVNYYDSSFKMIFINLYKSSTSSESGSIALNLVDLDSISVPYTCNADSNLFAAYPGFLWRTASGTEYQSEGEQGVDPFPYFTVTLTGKTSDVLEGTFSGLAKDSAGVKMQITEGSFKMKVSRK